MQLFRERFKRESRLAAAIDHPNVLPVYEAGETDGTLFISMRWVEGTDLATLIKRGGGLDAAACCRHDRPGCAPRSTRLISSVWFIGTSSPQTC